MIVDYIDRGYGLVITSRTRSRVREEMRRFLKDNHFNKLPKIEFIGTCEYDPELYQCYHNIKTMLRNNIGLFMWDGKDPYTLYEMLYYVDNPIEVYLTDKDELITTTARGMKSTILVPKRTYDSIPYTQAMKIPLDILKAMTFSEHVMNYISGHQWTRNNILAMINDSDIHLSQKTELYYQLTKQEDIIADMFDCFEDRNNNYSLFDLFELIENSAFFCYEESKFALNYHTTHSGNDIFKFYPSEACVRDASRIKYHNGRVVCICNFHPGQNLRLTGLYTDGDIIRFSSESTAIMCDSITNYIIIEHITTAPGVLCCYKEEELSMLDSNLGKELTPELLAFVKTIDPDYRDGRISSDTLSRIRSIINLWAKEHDDAECYFTTFTTNEIIHFLKARDDVPNNENEDP